MCRGNRKSRFTNAGIGNARLPDDAVERFRNCFEFGGHKAAIVGKAAKEFKLYLVSKLPEAESRKAFFTPAKSIEEALETILSENPEAKVHVMPHGGCTLPVNSMKKTTVDKKQNVKQESCKKGEISKGIKPVTLVYD